MRVTVIRGAGTCFSSGYDLGSNVYEGQPWHTAGGDGNWPRHVVEGWFKIWDLAKPVIAQVHGCCLAGGSELAARLRSRLRRARTRRSATRRCG